MFRAANRISKFHHWRQLGGVSPLIQVFTHPHGHWYVKECCSCPFVGPRPQRLTPPPTRLLRLVDRNCPTPYLALVISEQMEYDIRGSGCQCARRRWRNYNMSRVMQSRSLWLACGKWRQSISVSRTALHNVTHCFLHLHDGWIAPIDR